MGMYFSKAPVNGPWSIFLLPGGRCLGGLPILIHTHPVACRDIGTLWVQLNGEARGCHFSLHATHDNVFYQLVVYTNKY